jgi:hypothetical protein
MQQLTIGTRVFRTEERRVVEEAERMFRLTAAQRRYRIEAAKTRIARSVDREREEGGAAVRQAVATLLSQNIREI